jgi:four helix bundle protein
MQANTPSSSRLHALEFAIEAIQVLRPEQIRRALSSAALNTAEGSRSEGGTRLSRFSTAAGSNAEARAGLRVAVAWGYVRAEDVDAGEKLLDRVAALLHGLGARR